MMPQNVDVRPKLESDPPDRKRAVVPRWDAVGKLWHRLGLANGAKPIAGAVIVGGAALGLAMEIGVGELAIGVVAAYATYRMLRYGIDLKQALTETVQLEKALGGL